MSEIKYYPIELLHWAGMKDEHIDELIDILTAHPEYINETNDYKDNCLFIAARSGNIEMVKYIVENTAIDINHINGDGSALLVALAQGHNNIANYLLERKGIDIYVKNKKGEGIYHVAARVGNADLIEKLLEIDHEKRIRDFDSNGRHCLFQLIENYGLHKDYWCFELILGSLSDEVLWKRDIDGFNIMDYTEQKQYLKNEDGEVDKNKVKLYAPLINILMSRTVYGQLKENLPIKEGFEDKGKTKI